ncbi:hypothetical protein [Breoghania sp.]|uniref:hypothetical protein n=1 Tax=Breoghania sp. TaxID=2065378 RepID=UPI00261FA050|nr:hypothetical protein [Breoghania sp.]MDJ0932770.1 hypothetical protein [Breoghania sp.]
MFKAILKGSIQLCLSNFDDLIKAAGAWTVIMILFGIGAQVSGFGNQENAEQMMTANPGQFGVFVLVSIIPQAVASSSIAVAWHRFALLGEPPAMIHLRFGRSEFRYFLYSLLLGLFIGLAVLVLTLLVTLIAGGLSAFSARQGAAAISIVIIMGAYSCAPPCLHASGSCCPPLRWTSRWTPSGLSGSARDSAGRWCFRSSACSSRSSCTIPPSSC